MLATDCEEEALELQPIVRERLRAVTEDALEAPDPERRRLAARHKLARRLRNMIRLSDDLYIDSLPITNAEYQLFIDERRTKGEFRQPDHWDEYSFPRDEGRKPILGIRRHDAEEFCRWLDEGKAAAWRHSVPAVEEIQGIRSPTEPSPNCFLRASQDNFVFLPIEKIQDCLSRGVLTFFENRMIPGSAAWCRTSLILLLALDLDRPRDGHLEGDLRRDIELVRSLALDRNLSLSHNFSRNLSRARDFSSDLDPALEISRAIGRSFDRALELARDPDRARHLKGELRRARELASAFHLEFIDSPPLLPQGREPNEAFVRNLCALYLNWLCLVEKRVEGDLSFCESLWIVRRRVTTTNQPFQPFSRAAFGR